jgi:hypothetical protein
MTASKNSMLVTTKSITVVASLCYLTASFSTANAQYLVQANVRQCKHGLHYQPNSGPFAVFLFCDDALGSNIGVINVSKASNPGNKLKMPTDRQWKWWIDNRFWQDSTWSQDTSNFAWSPDLNFLFVASNNVYGNGGFYRLDLVTSETQRLLPSTDMATNSGSETSYQTEIVGIDLRKAELLVKVSFQNMATRGTKIERITINMNR